jgi:hypothetical protein
MSVTEAAPDRPTLSLDRALLALTAVALLARVAFLLLEPAGVLAGDESSWVEIGRRLFRPTKSWSPLDSDLIFYPPVYPYFIGLLYRVEHSFRTVIWAQVVLGALTVPAIGRAGAWAFGRRTGLLAAAITAIYPEFLWYPAHFWSETVYLLLLWWAIERTLAADPDRSVRRAAAAGLLFGLAGDLHVPRAHRRAVAPAAGRRGDGRRAAGLR